MANGIDELAQPNDPNQPGGLGEIRPGSKEIRDNKDRVDQGNSKGQLSAIPILIGGTDFGKILSQLEELRNEYDSYTGEHEQRLKTRLSESEERRQKFFIKADALREEILAAIQRQQVINAASDEEG